MTTGYILEQSEVGFLNYLSGSLGFTDFNYYRGMDDATKETPCVVVQATNADEDFPGSGIWHVMVKTYFIYPCDGSGSINTRNSKYLTFTEKLYDNTNITSSLSVSASNLCVIDVYGRGLANSIQQDHWVGENELELIATYKA